MTVLWLGGALAVMLAPLLAFEGGVMAAVGIEQMVEELWAERKARKRLERWSERVERRSRCRERLDDVMHANVCSQRGCLGEIAD